MIYPGCVVIAILDKISYDTWLTITRFPCSVTIRQELADSLVDIGFIFLKDNRYGITELGQKFLNNANSHTII